MNFINKLISEELINAIGWTLLHSLWQGALIALIIALGMVFFMKFSARFRYNLYVSGIIIFLGVVVVTFIKEYNFFEIENTKVLFPGSISSHEEITSAGFIQTADNNASETWGWVNSIWDYFKHHFAMLVTLWMGGILLLFLRLLGNMAYTQRVKVHRTYGIPVCWQDRFRELARRMRIKKPVRILESAIVKVPLVIGSLKPVILVPLGLISGLPVQQVEAIIAHELAHIVRKDYLVNILQSMIEVLFFYHPAIWWLSENIRIERENICDDMALEMCGDSLIYARALTSLQEMNLGTPGIALAFTGKKHLMLNRIQRMMKRSSYTSNFAERFIMAVVLFAGAITITASAVISPGNENEPHLIFNSGEQILILKGPGLENAQHTIVPDQEIVTVIEVTENLETDIDLNGNNSVPDCIDPITEIHITTVFEPRKDSLDILIRKAHEKALIELERTKLDRERALEDFQKALKQHELAAYYLDDAMKEEWKQTMLDHQEDMKQFYKEHYKDRFIFLDTVSFDSMDFYFNFPELSELPELPDFEMLNDIYIDALREYEFDFEVYEEHLIDIEEVLKELDRSTSEHFEILAEIEVPDLEKLEWYYDFPDHKTERIMKKELYRDKLIGHDGDYVIIINSKHMLINGEKQPREVYKKYRRLYESVEDEPLEGDNSYKLIF